MGRNLFTTVKHRNLSDFEDGLYSQWVAAESYQTYNNKTTTVILRLKSGFEIVGTAGCEDTLKFDEQLGHLCAVKDALRKLGEFAAFFRAEVKHQQLSTLPAKELRVDREFTKEEIAKLRDMWMKDLHEYENAHNRRFHIGTVSGISSMDCASVTKASNYPIAQTHI